MQCFKPQKYWVSKHNFPSGKPKRTYKIQDALMPEDPLLDRCGKCKGCRVTYKQAWTTRGVCEARMHEHNAFINPTYEDEHLPPNGSLDIKDVQLFQNRLRKEFNSQNLSFISVGEYGESGTNRPHYHMIVFGLNIPDLKKSGMSQRGHQLFESELIFDIWGKGRVEIGSTVSDQSIAYTLDYSMKKLGGKMAKIKYGSRLPEFKIQSLKPAIGKTYCEKYLTDIYPDDFIVLPTAAGGGRKVPPPPYFDTLLERINPDLHQQVVKKRRIRAEQFKRSPERSQRRLDVKAELFDRNYERKKRGY